METPMQLVALALLVLGCSEGATGPNPPPPQGLELELVASGLIDPLYLITPPGDDRLFVVEQNGRIRIIQSGHLVAAPFLDIRSKVSYGGERGLFSVAFHPDYASNGYFYVDYTDTSGDTRIERYTVSGDPNAADAGSAKLILGVDQPYANHNGGLIAFGPDGMLYIGMGDGGSAGDPQGNGQDRGTLLGALLRIDVDGGDPYAVPPDNPFVGQAKAKGEVWAYGLRNPWRWAFDPTAGLLYVADVGQNTWEEVDVIPMDSAGANFGWNVMEGNHCFLGSSCDRSGLVLPVLEYSHSDGCSITGGYVYRGSAIPGLQGHYFYADYCAGWVRSFRYASGSATDERQWDLGEIGQPLSFGQDGAGELYVMSRNGRVYRFVAS